MTIIRRGLNRLTYGRPGLQDYSTRTPIVPWTVERERRIQAIIKRVWSDPEFLAELREAGEAGPGRISSVHGQEASLWG